MISTPSLKPNSSYKLRLTRLISSRNPIFKLPVKNLTRRPKAHLRPSSIRKSSGSRVTKFSFRFSAALPRSHVALGPLNESFRRKVALRSGLNFYTSFGGYSPEVTKAHHLWSNQSFVSRFPLNFLSKSDLVAHSHVKLVNNQALTKVSMLDDSRASTFLISYLPRSLPYLPSFTGFVPSEIAQFSYSIWEEFIKFNYRSQLYDNLRDLNSTIKRERLVFFSFYSFYSDPFLEGTMRKTRVLIPDEQEGVRSSVYLTGSLARKSSITLSGNLGSRAVHWSPRSTRMSSYSSSAQRARGDQRFLVYNSRVTNPIRSVGLQLKVPSNLNRSLKFLKRKRRLVRQLSRFAKWSKRHRFYKFKRVVMRWSRTKARQLKFNLRKLRRKITLHSKLQHRLSRRSYLRGFLFRASRRKLLRRFSVEAPDKKFKRRQKGVFFKPHKALKQKFSRWKRSLPAPSTSSFKNNWVNLNLTGRSPAAPLTSVYGSTILGSMGYSRSFIDWSMSSDTYKLLAGDSQFFKYMITKFLQSTAPSSGQRVPLSSLFSDLKVFSLRLQNQFETYSTPQSRNLLRRSNLWTVNSVDKVIRKRLFRHVTSTVFPVDLSIWYYKTLVQFIENCSGRKSLLLMGPFIQNALTYEDKARCSLWNNRVTGFQRILGSRIFVHEALAIIVTAVRIKDPTFLSNWIRGMLKRLSFWKYRLIFRYVKFVLRYVLKPNFHLLDFRGVKLQLKGKISVAGNARTRTLFMRIGDTSHSKMSNRVAYDLSFVNTFTGIMGFKLWFFY